MKRFVRTFHVKRCAIYTVVQDGETRTIEVQRWGVGEKEVTVEARIDYPQETSEGARRKAIDLARALAFAEGTRQVN